MLRRPKVAAFQATYGSPSSQRMAGSSHHTQKRYKYLAANTCTLSPLLSAVDTSVQTSPPHVLALISARRCCVVRRTVNASVGPKHTQLLIQTTITGWPACMPTCLQVMGDKGMISLGNPPRTGLEFLDSSGCSTSPPEHSFPERFREVRTFLLSSPPLGRARRFAYPSS